MLCVCRPSTVAWERGVPQAPSLGETRGDWSPPGPVLLGETVGLVSLGAPALGCRSKRAASRSSSQTRGHFPSSQ